MKRTFFAFSCFLCNFIPKIRCEPPDIFCSLGVRTNYLPSSSLSQSPVPAHLTSLYRQSLSPASCRQIIQLCASSRHFSISLHSLAISSSQQHFPPLVMGAHRSVHQPPRGQCLLQGKAGKSRLYTPYLRHKCPQHLQHRI